MALLLDIASWLLLLSGAVVAVIGGVGMLRLPDVYTRMHAASVTDTGGMILIIGGLLLQAPHWLVAVKLLLVGLFLLLTSPTASNALANAAMQDSIKPMLGGRRRG